MSLIRELKDHADQAGYTLTTYAALGYIEGKDSWRTFAYLLGAGVPVVKDFYWFKKPSTKEEKAEAKKQQNSEKSVAQEFFEWLRTPLKDEENRLDREKDARRKQILKVLLELHSFEESLEEPF